MQEADIYAGSMLSIVGTPTKMNINSKAFSGLYKDAFIGWFTSVFALYSVLSHILWIYLVDLLFLRVCLVQTLGEIGGIVHVHAHLSTSHQPSYRG